MIKRASAQICTIEIRTPRISSEPLKFPIWWSGFLISAPLAFLPQSLSIDKHNPYFATTKYAIHPYTNRYHPQCRSRGDEGWLICAWKSKQAVEPHAKSLALQLPCQQGMIHGRGEAPAKSADRRAVAEISEYQQDYALPCGYHFFLITQKHAYSSPVSNLGTIVCDNLAMKK